MTDHRNPALVDAHLDCVRALTPAHNYLDFRADREPRVVNHGANVHVHEALDTARARGLVAYGGDRPLPAWNQAAWVCAVRLTAEGLATVRAYFADDRDE